MPASAQILEAATRLVNSEVGLTDSSELGRVLAGVGDLNGDGVEDLAIGLPGTFGGQGSVLLAMLGLDGTVDQVQVIADGILSSPLPPGAAFGSALAIVPDVDGAGPASVGSAVSAPDATPTGSVWLLLLGPGAAGSDPVRIFDAVEISTPEPVDALASIGDLDGDGLADLALGHKTYTGTNCFGVRVSILHLGSGGNWKLPLIDDLQFQRGHFGRRPPGLFRNRRGRTRRRGWRRDHFRHHQWRWRQ